MANNRKVQLEVGLDANPVKSGAEEVKAAVSDMANAVVQSGDKASKAVDGIGAGSEKSAAQMARAYGRIESEIKRVTAAAQAAAEGTGKAGEILNRAMSQGLDAAKLEPMLAKLRELEQANGRLVSSSRSFGSGLQNTSYQLQDFIVQVNGGTDATKALGMQLPQMLVGFGAAGAAIGVVAALLPNLVSAFSAAKEGAKDFKSAMSDFDQSVSSVGETTKAFDMEKLYEEFNKSSSAVRAATVEQLNFQREFIRTSQLVAEKKFGESLGNLGDYSMLDKLAGSFASSGAEKLSKQLGVSLSVAKDLLPALKGLRDGTEDVGLVFNKFGTTLLGGNAAASELAKSMASLAKSERDSAAASSTLSESQQKMAKGHVTTKKELDEAAKATKSLKKEQEELDALLNRINGKDSGFDSGYVKDVETLLKAYDKGKLSLSAFNDEFERLVKMQPGYVAALKEQSKFENDRSKYLSDLSKETEELVKKAEAAELENAKIGATAQELEQLNHQRTESTIRALEEKAAVIEMIGGRTSEVESIEAQINALRRLQAAEVARPKLQAQAREWEKFTDDINRSLTDALMRGFESGKSFGQNFVDSLKNSLKTTVLRVVVNMVTSTGGSLLNAGLNYLAGTSGQGNGGTGATNYLGLASNASSAYNLMNGNYASAAAGAYSYGSTALGSTYGTNAFSQQSMMLAAQDSGMSSSSLASSSYTGYLAILAGWLMSHEAWKNGIVWNNDYSFTNSPERSGVHGWEHEKQYRINSDLFGEDFAKSEWVQTLTFSALSQQLSNWIFGTESLRSSAVVGKFTEDGFNGANVQNMHKGGGWFGSGKDYQVFSDLPEGVKTAFDGMYKQIKGSFLDLGLAFSDSKLPEKLKNFSVDINDITTGKTFYGVAMEVSEYLMQQMGKTLLPSIESLKKSASEDGKVLAETWNQAFTRIVQETFSVNRMLEVMGKKMTDVFGQNNLDGILKASDAIVAIFGSVDNLNNSFGAYYQNFYSQADQTKQAWKDMDGIFAGLGKTTPKTREEFRAIVDSLDLSTEAGQKTFLSLMNVQSAFASLTPTIEELATQSENAAAAIKAAADAAAAEYAAMMRETILASIDSRQSAISAAADAGLASLQKAAELERQRATAAQQAASEQLNSIKSLFGVIDSQLASLYGSTGANAEKGKAFIANAVESAKKGYLPDSAELSDAINSVRSAIQSNEYATTFEKNFATLSLAGSLSQIKEAGQKQLPVAERALAAANDQLDAIEESLKLYEKQIDELRGIKENTEFFGDSINSVGDAIVKAISQQTGALNAAIIAGVNSGTVSSSDATQRLSAGGVTLDKVSNIGGQNAFVSSSGAIAIKDANNQVSIASNSGWRGSLDSAKSLIWQAFTTRSPADFYASVVSEGLSSAMIAEMFSIPQSRLLDWAKQNGLPAFAQGTNRVPQDMLALIHKDEAIVPAKYNPAAGGSRNGKLEELVVSLTDEVKRLQAISAEASMSARRTADAVNGNPESPMLVETV